MSNTFVILKRRAATNGVKVHFHNENQGDKKEQWPPSFCRFLLRLSLIAPSVLDLISRAIFGKCNAKIAWDILSSRRFFRTTVSFMLECHILKVCCLDLTNH